MALISLFSGTIVIFTPIPPGVSVFYVPFNFSDRFRQTVLAMATWTSYSPTWDERSNSEVKNRPPSYTGATLGGLWRMRGYPSQRFNDRAAIYYAAELRLIPDWNPFEAWPKIQKYVGIQWLQFVPFVEIGRVAPAGFGIRAMAQGIVIRIDTAGSDEGLGVQMMIAQPFQF
jgi:hypothetical protein